MLPVISIFGKEIYTYAVMAGLGAILAGVYACRIAKKRFWEDDTMLVMMLFSALGAFIGGALLYAITNIDVVVVLFKNIHLINSFEKFINAIKIVFGGSVFYGGLIGGMIAGVIYIKAKKKSVAEYSDIVAPAIPLFHSFGRIGCFLGGCCFGLESSLGFHYENHPLLPILNGSTRFPIQLVEAFINLMLFFLLATLLKKNISKNRLLCVYLFLYSIERFIIEYFRGDGYRGYLFGLSTSQIVSVILFVLSIVIFTIVTVKQKRR